MRESCASHANDRIRDGLYFLLLALENLEEQQADSVRLR